MRWLALALLACSGRSEPVAPSNTGSAAPPVPVVDAALAEAPPKPIDPAVIARLWPDGCFTIRDATGRIHASDPQRCAMPRRPYSTFKLANALIAVDLGLLANADAAMTWDNKAIPDQTDYLDVWRKPHTLRSGMKVSAVPYFRTLALQIGEQRMRAGLDKLAYGNRDLGGGLDRFWLARGALRISAMEQLAFVEGLARGTLAVSKHAHDVIREVSLLARVPDDDSAGSGTAAPAKLRLYGKTGSGPIEDTKGGWIVWQVGWVAGPDPGDIVPYACWLEAKAKSSDQRLTIDDVRAARDERLRATLDELDVFPRMQ